MPTFVLNIAFSPARWVRQFFDYSYWDNSQFQLKFNPLILKITVI